MIPTLSTSLCFIFSVNFVASKISVCQCIYIKSRYQYRQRSHSIKSKSRDGDKCFSWPKLCDQILKRENIENIKVKLYINLKRSPSRARDHVDQRRAARTCVYMRIWDRCILELNLQLLFRNRDDKKISCSIRFEFCDCGKKKKMLKNKFLPLFIYVWIGKVYIIAILN